MHVAIKVAGISFVDVLTAAGQYQVKPPLPFCPGSEAAGTVIERGADVRGFAVGDRVVCSAWGGLAEAATGTSAGRIVFAMDWRVARKRPFRRATA